MPHQKVAMRAREIRTNRRATGSSSQAVRKTRVGHRSPEEPRQEIIEAARKYLSENSYHSLTIDKLMARTKIGRTAFYTYFDNLYDIAEIFMHEISTKIEEAVAEWFDVDSELGPADRIQMSLRNGIKIWEADGEMIAALEQASAMDNRLLKIWKDKLAKGPVYCVAEAIQRDQRAGLIGPMDAQAISIALTRFTFTYLNDCFGWGHQTDPDAVLRTLERVWVGSLFCELPSSLIKETKIAAKRPRKSAVTCREQKQASD